MCFLRAHHHSPAPCTAAAASTVHLSSQLARPGHAAATERCTCTCSAACLHHTSVSVTSHLHVINMETQRSRAHAWACQPREVAHARRGAGLAAGRPHGPSSSTTSSCNALDTAGSHPPPAPSSVLFGQSPSQPTRLPGYKQGCDQPMCRTHPMG